MQLEDKLQTRPFSRDRQENAGRYNTLHGCIDMLNLSHQLLNPIYFPRELATEAANVFYRQNVFEFNVLSLPSFM